MKCTTRHSYRTKISNDEKRIEIGFIKLFKVNFRQPTSMKTILIERENGFGDNQPTRMDDIGAYHRDLFIIVLYSPKTYICLSFHNQSKRYIESRSTVTIS